MRWCTKQIDGRATGWKICFNCENILVKHVSKVKRYRKVNQSIHLLMSMHETQGYTDVISFFFLQTDQTITTTRSQACSFSLWLFSSVKILLKSCSTVGCVSITGLLLQNHSDLWCFVSTGVTEVKRFHIKVSCKLHNYKVMLERFWLCGV